MRGTYVYIVKKVLLYAMIFFLSLSAFFFFINLVPGDPVSRFVATLEGRFGLATPITTELIQEYRAEFGLDKPLFTRYLYFMRELILNQQFGPSFLAFPTPAHELILDALPWSVGLLSFSVLIAFTIGIVIGTFVGWKRGTGFDSTITSVALLVGQVPSYLLALFLTMFLAFGLALFPTGGAYAAYLTPAFSLEFVLSLLRHATLPALSVVVTSVAAWLITQRALVINILGEDYVQFAEAKGLKNTRLINRYILRNTLLPQAAGIAMSLGFIVNGFFLIEWIFRYPGIGFLFISAIRAVDLNVLMGTAVVTMFFVLMANFLVDLLYPLIDPRIRRGGV